MSPSEARLLGWGGGGGAPHNGRGEGQLPGSQSFKGREGGGPRSHKVLGRPLKPSQGIK